jgi:site-specific DNA-methyltransferase (adenine-specific)
MGSGTTGVACNNTNRKFIGIERDREYYNIALDRLSSLPFDITKL